MPDIIGMEEELDLFCAIIVDAREILRVIVRHKRSVYEWNYPGLYERTEKLLEKIDASFPKR